MRVRVNDFLELYHLLHMPVEQDEIQQESILNQSEANEVSTISETPFDGNWLQSFRHNLNIGKHSRKRGATAIANVSIKYHYILQM
jgi:hypothetical protein